MSDIVVYDNHVKVSRAVKGAMKQAATMIGGSISGHASEGAPIDTGLLRNSITYALGGDPPAIQQYTDDEGIQTGYYDGTATADDEHEITVYVGSNVEYAPYQELGAPSINLPARAYLRPAFESNEREIMQIIQMCFRSIG